MLTLMFSDGIYLKKLYTPDNKTCHYSVTAPNLPIMDKIFQEDEYEKAVDYYNKSTESRASRQKI